MNPKVADFIIYVLLPLSLMLFGMYFGQRKLMYIPSQAIFSPQDVQVPGFEEVTLTTSDQLNLRSWYFKADNKPTILYLHGNAGNFAHRAPIVKAYMAHGYGVLLLGYRGYGGNPGSPTEAGLYRDARAGVEFLKSHGVKPANIVLFGESLGTGVAVQMALEYPVKSLVLQSAYTSMVDVGHYHYPFLPVSWLLKDRYDSASKIERIKQPLLFLHGINDRIVPVTLAKKLVALANAPKVAKYYPDHGHNDLVSQQLQADVLDFLKNY